MHRLFCSVHNMGLVASNPFYAGVDSPALPLSLMSAFAIESMESIVHGGEFVTCNISVFHRN